MSDDSIQTSAKLLPFNKPKEERPINPKELEEVIRQLQFIHRKNPEGFETGIKGTIQCYAQNAGYWGE